MSLSSRPSSASGHSQSRPSQPSQLTESLLGGNGAHEKAAGDAAGQAPSKCCPCSRGCVSNVAHLLQLTLWFGLTIFGIAQHKVAGPLIAADQVGNATWATLPVALTDIGGIIFAIPVSLIVKRIGWRKGFMVGGAVGVLSSMICFVATWFDNYYVLIFGSLFMSVWNVCGYYVRFAAAESVDPSWDTSRVISYVLVSSAVTGSFGPQMVALMNNFVTDYFSVYIEVGGVAALCIAIAICMRRDTPVGSVAAPTPVGNANRNDGEVDSDNVKLQFSNPGGDETCVDGENGNLPLDQGDKDVVDAQGDSDHEDPPRSLCDILCQPVTITAVVSEMVGMFVMLLVMTATPIAMHGTQANSFNFPLEQTTLTIQIHIVCMFLPGLVTGDIVRIIGVSNTILGGTLCYAGAVVVGILDHTETGFMVSLVLLGIGWNWTYVGGTRLLITAYRPNESKVVQGVNESLAQAAAALGAFLAGIMLGEGGWDAVLFTAVPATALNFGAYAFYQVHQCCQRSRT